MPAIHFINTFQNPRTSKFWFFFQCSLQFPNCHGPHVSWKYVCTSTYLCWINWAVSKRFNWTHGEWNQVPKQFWQKLILPFDAKAPLQQNRRKKTYLTRELCLSSTLNAMNDSAGCNDQRSSLPLFWWNTFQTENILRLSVSFNSPSCYTRCLS